MDAGKDGTRTMIIGKPLPGLFVLAVFVVAGCGWQQYESRMQASAGYYEYLGRVKVALSDHVEEGLSGFGITIRVPARYRWIDATVQSGSDGDQVAVPVVGDRRRQQTFSRRGLAGLLGSWNSVLVNNKTGKEGRGRSRMYLFGNYARFLDRNEGTNVNPMEFHEDLVNEMAGALGVAAPLEADWKYEQVPKRGGFADPKDYTLIEMSKGATEFRLYLYPARRSANDEDDDVSVEEEHLQFALLFEIPAGTPNPVKLDEGIGYCLEWIHVTGSVPQPLAPGEKGRGGGGGVAF